MVSAPFPHMPSVPRASSQVVPSLQASSPITASQEMISNNDHMQDLKPMVSMAQPLRPVGPAAANVSSLNNLSQARQVMNSAALTGGTSIGPQSIGGTSMAMHMSNMISSGMASSVSAAQTVLPSGQSAITSNAGSGTLAGTAQVAQNSAPGSFTFASSNISGTSNLGMSQPLGNLQGGVSMGQSVPGMNQGNLPGAQMVQGGMGMNQNMMSGGPGLSGMSSGTGTMIPTPGMTQQGQPGMQSLGVNNNSAANMSMSQQTSSGLQSARSKYVKVWEGNLSGLRQGQSVFITRLEGYRSASASETLAANWPPTMQIVRLYSQDHMNKQYVGKSDFLVFRAMNQHGFLGQLQKKKLCAVIQLPSQTLMLSVTDKACRLIGKLFPADMVVFKPLISSQQQKQQLPQMQQEAALPQMQQQQQMFPRQMQQQQQSLRQIQQQQQQQQQLSQMLQLEQQQQQQQQQISQLQQQISQLQQMISQLQQQHPQQQHMVGTGMGQAYVQGPNRSQLVSEGQVSSQGSQNMPGGGFMS